MKSFFALLIVAIAMSCQQESKPLRYADVDTSSNKIVHLTDKDDLYYSLTDLIAEQQGKVVYVNFWNSYAPYSMALMPALEKLEKDLEGMDAVILNISTDQAIMPFEKHLSITTLKNNYLARNYPQAEFYIENDVLAPRFLLYDKNGKLIDDNAMAPDNENLKQTIEVLLEQ